LVKTKRVYVKQLRYIPYSMFINLAFIIYLMEKVCSTLTLTDYKVCFWSEE